MCGIAGFCCHSRNHKEEAGKWYAILQEMNQSQKHRGPDDEGVYLSCHTGLAQVRLSVIDPESGHQPIIRQLGNHRAAIVYNGEVYNMPSLRKGLEEEGITLTTKSDTEVVLMGYLLHGLDYLTKLNGIFAFAIADETLDRLYLVRDRLGVKPLFYTIYENALIFSSEIKGILSYPGIEPIADKESLCEIFGLGPAKTYGKGVFKNIYEVLPGHYLQYSQNTFRVTPYWQLQSMPHEDTWEQTLEKTRYLVTDAIELQMLSDVPICTFLSGGVDSSLVTAVCSNKLQSLGKILNTYSFDFKDNDLHFKANDFQPSIDRPWVDKMVLFANSNHHYLECTNTDLYHYLYKAVDARDLPCMADVEASMLYFCEKVSKHHKVALTGECADEIFGGYPWFHRKECLDATIFPWSMDFSPRTMLLKDDILTLLPLKEYAHAAYESTLRETPILPEENPEETKRRQISYLNLKWFMQTLLDRMDRSSMHAGLEARVPFADYRIVEYLWNVPWEMKCKDGVVKGLLREAAKDLLPVDVMQRKKSPYPKTYDPEYEKLLQKELMNVLSDSASPLSFLIDKEKTKAFICRPSDYGRPFYGQLMAGPQLMAYLLQVNYWLEKYKIRIVL